VTEKTEVALTDKKAEDKVDGEKSEPKENDVAKVNNVDAIEKKEEVTGEKKVEEAKKDEAPVEAMEVDSSVVEEKSAAVVAPAELVVVSDDEKALVSSNDKPVVENSVKSAKDVKATQPLGEDVDFEDKSTPGTSSKHMRFPVKPPISKLSDATVYDKKLTTEVKETSTSSSSKKSRRRSSQKKTPIKEVDTEAQDKRNVMLKYNYMPSGGSSTSSNDKPVVENSVKSAKDVKATQPLGEDVVFEDKSTPGTSSKHMRFPVKPSISKLSDATVYDKKRTTENRPQQQHQNKQQSKKKGKEESNVRRCSVEACQSSIRPGDKGVSFHKFPSNSELRKIWQEQCHLKKQATISMSVCSRHFRRIDFQYFNGTEYLLKLSAIPSMFDWGVTPYAGKMPALKKHPNHMRLVKLSTRTVQDKTKTSTSSSSKKSFQKKIPIKEVDTVVAPTVIDVPVIKTQPIKFNVGCRIEVHVDDAWHSATIIDVDRYEALIQFDESNGRERIAFDSVRLRSAQPIISITGGYNEGAFVFDRMARFEAIPPAKKPRKVATPSTGIYFDILVFFFFTNIFYSPS
jgi:hypothetical protein